MKKVEILAPAGSFEALRAAVIAGCDAVYLGGYLFSARSFASNFSDEEMINAVEYAHLYNVKIYVTLNILVYENEVEMFLKYVDFLVSINVDAIILQDIGMLDLIRKTYPDLEIHASTQMHIHNTEGVLLLEEMGVSRCVLARETPVSLIEEISKKIKMELEIFVHGALCISYSGQCLMSSFIGGRSGNRGTCAQTCRQEYTIGDKSGYFLSAKDLNTIENLGQIIKAGASSLKIEGRMKRPEYVYLMVSLYKKAVDNYYKYKETRISNDDLIEIEKIFNREFTNGFVLGDKDIVNSIRPNHKGIEIGEVISVNKDSFKIKLSSKLIKGDGVRVLSKVDFGFTVVNMLLEKEKVNIGLENNIIEFKLKNELKVGDVVYKTTDKEQIDFINEKILRNEKKIDTDLKAIFKIDNFAELTLKCGNTTVTVIGSEKVSVAVNKPMTKEDIFQKLSKIGDTVYNIANYEIELDSDSFISLKELNGLKREAFDLLNKKRLSRDSKTKQLYTIEVPNFDVSKNINAYICDENQISSKYKNIYCDSDLFQNLNIENKILRIDRVIEKHEEYDQELLVSELGSVRKYGEVSTDFSLNVVNSYAVAFLHSLGVKQITLSYELTVDQIKEIVNCYHERYKKHPNLEVIVSSRPEVMISKYKIENSNYLKDRFKNNYPIIIKNNLMHIYNYKKIDNSKIDYFKLGINNIRYNFTKFD